MIWLGCHPTGCGIYFTYLRSETYILLTLSLLLKGDRKDVSLSCAEAQNRNINGIQA